MLSAKVTVLIPVGPKFRVEWLREAVESVLSQTETPHEIYIVDDGAGITDQVIHDVFDEIRWAGGNGRYESYWFIDRIKTHVRLYHSPANIGFSQAFNCGVALAENDLIIYLAADDKLEPDAIKDCVEAWEENNQKDAWYALTYSDAGRIDDTPINAAMITRGLWDWLGGYPPAAFAGPDAALLSILMYWNSDRIIKVNPGKVNYFIKKHDFQETKVTAQRFSEEMTTIRTKLTLDFKPRNGIVLK